MTRANPKNKKFLPLLIFKGGREKIFFVHLFFFLAKSEFV